MRGRPNRRTSDGTSPSIRASLEHHEQDTDRAAFSKGRFGINRSRRKRAGAARDQCRQIVSIWRGSSVRSRMPSASNTERTSGAVSRKTRLLFRSALAGRFTIWAGFSGMWIDQSRWAGRRFPKSECAPLVQSLASNAAIGPKLDQQSRKLASPTGFEPVLPP